MLGYLGRTVLVNKLEITREKKRSPVAESCHVRHLNVSHIQELVPVLILQLHDVEYTLHTLQENIGNFPGELKA